MKFRYLLPEDIRALQRFVFAPRTFAEGRLAGRHRSLAIGSSTEFRDYRPYVPGDDLRRVDWRVFARTDRFFLRTHNQETNTACNIFLDSSASMGFGAPASKLDYASTFAAALAWLVTRSNDAVSLHLFDRDLRRFIPPGSTPSHLHNLLRALETNSPAQPTSVARALRRSLPAFDRKGSLVILSDFFDDAAGVFEALNAYLHRGFEVYLFHLLTPEELDLPDKGLTTFLDMETGQRIITHTRSIREAYRGAMSAHVRNLRDLARRRQVHYTLARTDRPHLRLFDELT